MAGTVRPVREWLVAADDRTGAFEVAALFAAAIGPVTVAVGRPVEGPCVVDLGSRGLDGPGAAAVAAGVDGEPSGWTAHKMDSTLRGNWVAEVRVRQLQRGCRVVVLPGWPALGRTCVDGVVHVHGSPVGSVLNHLPEASLVRTASALGEWLAGDGSVAVCDIPDTPTMDAMAAMAALAARGERMLIAGPAGPLGAAFEARFGVGAPTAVPPIEAPALVVCGSANSVSREQLARLAAEHPEVVIVAAPDADGPLHTGAAQTLAAEAHAMAAALTPATVILLGGDTAAAYLGEAPRLVCGSAAVGMPWSRNADGEGPLVITKAGGFGGPGVLVGLFSPRRG